MPTDLHIFVQRHVTRHCARSAVPFVPVIGARLQGRRRKTAVEWARLANVTTDIPVRGIAPTRPLSRGRMKVAALVVTGMFVAASAAFSFQERDLEVGASIPPDTVELPVLADASPTARSAPAPWVRPAGPIRVALQAGHWKAAEAPDEQAGLRANGTRGGGKAEWEVNLTIANLAAEILREGGILVEVLPTTIPPGYYADLFVSIHADGNNSPSVSGFRAAAPRRDQTQRAAEFVTLLEQAYGAATGLRHYPTITRRMTSYYAFNSRRYEHALHPMTVGVILETGFLTSPSDRRIIVEAPDRAARGIADAVTRFVEPLHAQLAASLEIVPPTRTAPAVNLEPIRR